MEGDEKPESYPVLKQEYAHQNDFLIPWQCIDQLNTTYTFPTQLGAIENKFSYVTFGDSYDLQAILGERYGTVAARKKHVIKRW